MKSLEADFHCIGVFSVWFYFYFFFSPPPGLPAGSDRYPLARFASALTGCSADEISFAAPRRLFYHRRLGRGQYARAQSTTIYEITSSGY